MQTDIYVKINVIHDILDMLGASCAYKVVVMTRRQLSLMKNHLLRETFLWPTVFASLVLQKSTGVWNYNASKSGIHDQGHHLMTLYSVVSDLDHFGTKLFFL